MQLKFKEHSGINYKNYEFPYCVYGIKESTDNYTEIYSKGFLPYTNELDINEEIYYLARSIRVDLNTKLWNYKQKNVFNKFSKLYDNDLINIRLQHKEELMDNPDFRNWCISNAKNSFLSEERLDYILSRPYLQNIMTISYEEEILAYIFIVKEKESFLHVWYSFYNLENTANDFGKWILLKIIEWSKSQGFSYFYIGTCYSKSAFYKLTLSPFSQYYDGSEWFSNLSELKKRLLNNEI